MMKVKAEYSAPGGVHPAYNKDLAADSAIQVMPVPALLTVSMSQHLGAPAKPVVAKGDTVAKGQLIGEAAGFISASVHAPTSGTVKNIVDAPTATGAILPAIVIEPDGEDRLDPAIVPCPDWKQKDAKDLISAVAAAGVAGMGGAGFPTHVKLSPPPGKTIDALIINGAECEPYLTADYRLMVEHAQQIRDGIEVMRAILGTDMVRVAIEDNKPEAISALEQALSSLDGDVKVAVLKTEYPQGAEKQQIYALTGREVPSGGLPMDVGALVENVSTVTAIWNAVVNGMPLVERLTTVTGTPVARPGNVRARIGSSYADLLTFCGGMTDAAKLISGGPMMGFAQASDEIATTKTTSGILALSRAEVSDYSSMPCISCGRCVDACPMSLMPAELSQFMEAEDYETAESYSVMDCIECGCCAFACPAHRPLVQHMRRGKAEVGASIRARKEAQDV